MSKVERLLERNSKSVSLAPLLKHPEVVSWFQRFEDAAVNDIISADNVENMAREVMRLAVFRELRTSLENIVSSGEAAGRRLSEAKDSDAVKS